MVEGEYPQAEVCLFLSASPYGSAATTRPASLKVYPRPSHPPSHTVPPPKTPRPSFHQTPQSLSKKLVRNAG